MAGESVLIVEDDDIIARVEDWRLKNLGYIVYGRATNGVEAMDLIANKMPDIVLMRISKNTDSTIS